MCDLCRNKSRDLARLARFFRDSGNETPIRHYRDLMLKTAAELAALSRYFAETCRCAETPEQYEAALQPRRGEFLPNDAGKAA